MTHGRIATGIAVVLGALLLTPLGGVAYAQQQETASVTVFHAVPADDGFPADVYLDGVLIIDGFVFETSSDVFDVPAGVASLEIFPDGSDPGTATAAVSTEVTFEAGANYSVVAQIADGSPVITIFENDTNGVGPGESRLTFRQTSGFDELSVLIDGAPTFSALAATEEASKVVPSGDVLLEVRDGAGNSVFEQQLNVEDGTLTVLYGVGDPASGTFDILVQELSIPQVSPAGVPTGSGGDKANSTSLLWPVGYLAGVIAIFAIARWRAA